MMKFEEFKRRTPKPKTKRKEPRQAPAAQAADQVNPSKASGTPDAGAEGDPGIVMGVIESVRPSGKR